MDMKPQLGRQLNNGHPLARGLVGYWLMNEGGGININDLSGNKISGILGGNVSWISGKFGAALDFPGASADAIEPGKPVFDCSKPFSFSVWINPDSGGSQHAIITKYTGGASGLLLRRDAVTTLDIWLTNYSLQLNSTVNSGSWYHVFVTYNGTSTYVYVNAILDSATPYTRTLSETGNLQIGKSELGNYNGQLDMLIIWQRYFPASEIASLYREPFQMFYDYPTELLTGATSGIPISVQDYSRGAVASLPLDDAILGNVFSSGEYTQVATDDADRVSQTAIGKYAVFLFIDERAQQESLQFEWNGQTSLAPSESTVYLQVYNRTSGLWETLDSDNTSSADLDFTLTGMITADLINYFDTSLQVSCRVYQYAG